MARGDDATSVAESVEFTDAIIDSSWNEHLLRDNRRNDIDDDDEGMSWWWRKFFGDRVLTKRIEEHERRELQVFIAQKLFKVDGLVCDEITRLTVIEKMVLNSGRIDDFEPALEYRYGDQLSGWLRSRLMPHIADCSSVLLKTAQSFNAFSNLDPLCNWYRQSSEMSSLVVARIERFASQMCRLVGWSLLVQPGKLVCHLQGFVDEYHRLEAFFTNNELLSQETAQLAFNDNLLTKSRFKSVPCCDLTRVVLTDNQFDGAPTEIWNDAGMDIAGTSPYGSSDFIHANYVRGGPLLNSFICTQAPLHNTQADFWRMVYQEKCGMIIMLCSAVEAEALGALDESAQTKCAFYWPRGTGESMKFGSLIVTNRKVDGTIDPLFNVTYLEVKRIDGEGESVFLEHWQWDWQNMCDVHWPLRVLRRARLLPSTTVVQCMDGCGRSGALVAIETALMTFVRGSPLDEDVVLLSCVFVRLQRRLSISSSLLYLFVYRVVLHWLAPYVRGWWHRACLGLIWPSTWGFVPEFNLVAHENARVLPSF